MGKEQMPFERGKEDQPNILLMLHTVMQQMERLADKKLPPAQKDMAPKPRRHKATGMFPKEFEEIKKEQLEESQRERHEMGPDEER